MIHTHDSRKDMPQQGGRSRSGPLNAALLLLVCLSYPGVTCAYAPQVSPDDSRPGNFVTGPDEKIGGINVADPQRLAALSLAEKVRAVLSHDPGIAHPVGYSVRLQRAYGRRTDWAQFDSGLPFYAGVFGTLFAPSVKPSPTSFGNPEFGVYVNTVLQCPLNEFSPPSAHGTAWHLNGNLPVVQGGRRTGTFHGYPLYDGDCLILTHSKQPPFRPLTRADYLQLQIADLKANLDKTHQQFAGQSLTPALREAIATADQQIQGVIAQQEQELASMDSETRQAPAAVRTGYEQAELVDESAEDAVPLSVPNPAFFDRSLPPLQVQAVVLFLPFLQSDSPRAGLPAGLAPDWKPAVQQIRDGLDWAALEALLP